MKTRGLGRRRDLLRRGRQCQHAAMPAGRGLSWLLPLLLVAGCAPAVTPSPRPPALPAAADLVETGQASWYGHPHHGRRTASGEVFDMNELTAAHRTLPLGTRVLVTNTDTGEALEVRINDRGPFARGRILDLSYAAGRILGAVGPGVIPVRLRVIALPEGAAPAGGRFAVQVGAFSSRERAEALGQTLGREGTEVVVSEARAGGETYYRVRVGSYADRAAAENMARRLAERGHRPVVVER